MELVKDVISGITASMVISPSMSVIDLAIIKSQLNKQSLGHHLKNTVFQLGQYQGCIRTMTWVYGATYVTANVTNNLLCTSLVNILAIAYKDISYSRYFTNAKVRNWRTNILFAIRDSITIHGSFAYGPCFVYPILSQIITTPFHIYGMDLMTRPNVTTQDRLKRVFSTYTEVCKGRVFRVVPSFIIGVSLNDVLRRQLI